MENLLSQVFDVINKDLVGVLTTVQDNKPHARYMMFFHDEKKLYTATNIHTHKVEEINNNPNVHVLLGYTQENHTYIELQGTASVVTDDALKQKYWSEKLKPWLEGPDDPNYCLLEITPNHIELIEGNKEKEI